MRGESGGKERRESRDRAVHQAGKAWLDHLQQKQLAVRLIFLRSRLLGEMLFLELPGGCGVLALFIGKLVEQLARGRVRHAVRGLLIEAHGFHFHDSGVFARRVDTQWPHEPERTAFQKPFHVFTANRWNMIAKALAKGRQEAVAMIHLFRAHFLEHLRGRRIALAQSVGEFAVNAASSSSAAMAMARISFSLRSLKFFSIPLAYPPIRKES